MAEYDDTWKVKFEMIKEQLAADLAAADASFISIIHIGSTAIPNLNAKNIIDILITIHPTDFCDEENILPQFRDALRDGEHQAGYSYIGNGGFRERWSFKLGVRYLFDGTPAIPLRNVYVVPDGGIHHRSTVTLRDALRSPANQDLKDEYGRLKWALKSDEDSFSDIMQYSMRKDVMVRKILRRSGWTEEMVDEKEAMRETNWPDFLIM